MIDRLRRSFWVLPLTAMIAGGALGFAVPLLDSSTGGSLGVFTTSDRDSARGLLETIATVTVSVAGITFSVTVVALQLASQQLGPRVLRTFQNDRLSQATLAVFLGLFVYSLIALGRLSTVSLADEVDAPNLVLTIGVLAAVLAFALFAAFIQNTIVSLQASTVIARITSEAVMCARDPFPSGFGAPGERGHGEAERAVETATVRASRAGFLNSIPSEVLELAESCEAIVTQRVEIGEFVIAGTAIAIVESPVDAEQLAERVAEVIAIAEERTLVQDVGFPVRQLGDVALRALSPSLNDPTTAETAVGAMTHVLAEFARGDRIPLERAGSDGRTRFVALAPDLDDLVRLGFEQVRDKSAEHPVFRARLRELLTMLREIAADCGRSTDEVDRQLELTGS